MAFFQVKSSVQRGIKQKIQEKRALFGGGWIVSKRDSESTRGYKMLFRSTTSCDGHTASSSIIISIITDDGAHIPLSLFDSSSTDYGSSHAITDTDFSCAVSAISRFNIYEKTTPDGDFWVVTGCYGLKFSYGQVATSSSLDTRAMLTSSATW